MKIISAKEAKNSFGSFIDSAQKEPVMITKRDRPIGIFFSMQDVESLTRKNSATGSGFASGYVLADKGYDSDRFVAAITANQGIPVIPSKKNRKTPRALDKTRYKERNRVERLFQKLKHFMRVATRC